MDNLSNVIAQYNINCIDKEKYILFNNEQWWKLHKVYKNKRISSSKFDIAAGWSHFKTKEILGNELNGIFEYGPKTEQETIEEEMGKIRMEKGKLMESYARKEYITYTGECVTEPLKCIPRWNNKISCEPDGLIGNDGTLEIKCVEKIYPCLVEHVRKLSNGIEFPRFYYKHIYSSHYCQIQGVLNMMERSWCDYFVYEMETKMFYLERIERNIDFWENLLYPELRNFISKYLV